MVLFSGVHKLTTLYNILQHFLREKKIKKICIVWFSGVHRLTVLKITYFVVVADSRMIFTTQLTTILYNAGLFAFQRAFRTKGRSLQARFNGRSFSQSLS